MRHALGLVAAAAALFCIAACTAAPPSGGTTPSTTSSVSEKDLALLREARGMFETLPAALVDSADPVTHERVALGKMLYHETRLSKSSTLSCNSCHNLAAYGVDGGPTSLGHRWTAGARNAPTTLNAALHVAQFWDGRAKDVEEQAKGPVLNPGEMAMPHGAFAVERIASIPEYCDRFARAFPGEAEPVKYENIARAIGAFERTLLTPSRFDTFLRGDAGVLTPDEKTGLRVYLDAGCGSCHAGPAAGGRIFQKFGVYKPYAALTGSKSVDEGRFAVTKAEADRQVFKVPSLRNIAHTAPYFHDGSVWGLTRSVQIMSETQLGQTLGPEQAASLAAFLNSLTGELPQDARTLPLLPASTAATPRPDFS